MFGKQGEWQNFPRILFFLTNIYQKENLTNITFLLLFAVASEVFMLSFNTGMDSWLPY